MTDVSVHGKKKSIYDGPGICNNGCEEWFICENHTERVLSPKNVEIVDKLREFAKKAADDGFSFETVLKFHGKVGFYISVEAHPYFCRHGITSTCEFLGIQEVAKAVLKQAESFAAEDCRSSDASRRALENAKSFEELTRELVCCTNHHAQIKATEDESRLIFARQNLGLPT